jgi:ABC-type Zn uptake system ZnuABC Zn-binding protein ZnuA
LAGLVKLIAPDMSPHCLLPPGADAHDFKITPRQAQRLARSNLLIRSSRDDGHWPQLSGRTPVMDIWPGSDHAWLVPDDVEHALPDLAAGLKRADVVPGNDLDQSLARALDQVRRIRREWRQALAPLRKTGVIIEHTGWRRLFESYGVPVRAVLESIHHMGSPGPKRLEQALNLLRNHPDTVLVRDKRHSNRSLTWLARHADKPQTVTLDALGVCGMPWTELMQDNIRRIETR